MTKIVVSSEGLSRLSTELENEKVSITGYIKNLNNELDAISTSWQGADATKYLAKMKDDYSYLLDEYNNSLESYSEYLGKVFSEYEKIDNKYQGMKIEV